MSRKILKTFLFVLLLNTYLFSQWSNDANNNLIIGYGADPHICSDSTGGCYITYNAGEPSELFLRRLDKYGYQPWGYKKQILGELEEQRNAEIIEDGEGGVIISYLDQTVNWPYFTDRVRVQRVDSIGNFLWGQTGVKATVADTNHGLVNLVSDGEGGCVILLQDYDGSLIINRINYIGERAWGDSGIILEPNNESAELVRAGDGYYYVQTSTIYRINQNGQIVNQYYGNMLGQPVPDPEGGVVLSGRVWTGMIPKLVTQRKDSLGNNLWQEPYVEIADSLYINSPINVKRINGYYYYWWHGRKNGIDLVAQYQALRSDGTKLFSQGSIPISNYPVDALFGDIINSDQGTFMLIWQDYRPDDGVFGQRKDTLGSELWNSDDVPLYTGTYSELHAITDCAGGAIGLGWHQLDFTIRAFKVSKNGILGEVITDVNIEDNIIIPTETVLYQNFPNPFNSSTTIQFQLPKESKINIDLYNVLGEKIQTIANGLYRQGMNSIIFSSDGLPSGIYLYKLQTETNYLTKKLIIIK